MGLWPQSILFCKRDPSQLLPRLPGGGNIHTRSNHWASSIDGRQPGPTFSSFRSSLMAGLTEGGGEPGGPAGLGDRCLAGFVITAQNTTPLPPRARAKLADENPNVNVHLLSFRASSPFYFHLNYYVNWRPKTSNCFIRLGRGRLIL